MDRNELIKLIQNGDSEALNKYLNEQNSISDNFPKIVLKFENKSKNPNPEYAKIGDSGFDIMANLEEPFTLKAWQRALIPTGLFFEINLGFELQIRPRSGLAAKHGITVLNTPGTVDSGYRGEVKVILINLSDEDYIINNGDRIAQGVYASVYGKHILDLKQVDSIDTNTMRGNSGFGSSGK